MGLLVAFLLLSIESYLASYTLGIFRLSFAKFGPTEIRILLVVANTFLFFLPSARISEWSPRLLDIGGAIAMVAMTAMFLFRRHNPHSGPIPPGNSVVRGLPLAKK